MFKFVAEASSSKINKTGLLQIQKQRELIIGRDKKFELKLTQVLCIRKIELFINSDPVADPVFQVTPETSL